MFPLSPHRVRGAWRHSPRARGRTLLAAALMMATASAATTAHAQAGTARFAGVAANALPTVGFADGPALTFSARVLSGFGNSAVVVDDGARWWPSEFSGQGMVYGSSSTSGHVLELRFEATSGFDLFLDGALFGGFANTARSVRYQLFNDDYSQSNTLSTILTGTTSPASVIFTESRLGNVVRLQFTEADGRGPFVVGIQDVAYRVVAPVIAVPEPTALLLITTGLALLVVRAAPRRTASR